MQNNEQRTKDPQDQVFGANAAAMEEEVDRGAAGDAPEQDEQADERRTEPHAAGKADNT